MILRIFEARKKDFKFLPLNNKSPKKNSYK